VPVKPFSGFHRLTNESVDDNWSGAEGNRGSSFSALTREPPQDTIFDRIHRALTPGSNPYLVEKYASCKTPNTDGDVGRDGSGGLFVSDSTEASSCGQEGVTGSGEASGNFCAFPTCHIGN